MTLAEKIKLARSASDTAHAPGDGGGCESSADAAKEEVLVFRRDPKTGVYDMFKACCEAILSPLRAA